MEQVFLSIISIHMCTYKHLYVQGHDVSYIGRSPKKFREKSYQFKHFYYLSHFHPEQFGFLMSLEV